MAKALENKVVNWANNQILDLGWRIHDPEQLVTDKQIESSLKNNPSKKGGSGGGRPDYTIMIENGEVTIPVIIEDKGTKNRLVKLDGQNLVVLRNSESQFDYKSAIPSYAVNGAVYYAMNVVKDTEYQEALAVGINGYDDSTGETVYEISVYVVNKKDPELPIKLGDYVNLDFLKNTEPQKSKLFKNIEDVQMDPHELEQRAIRDDAKIEAVLKELNQKIHEEQQIIPSQRINIVAGALMAAVGVKDKKGNYVVSRLKPEELTGSTEYRNTDGEKIVRKIENFLMERKLPEQKQRQIVNVLKSNFVDNNLNNKSNTETQTPIKTIYKEIYDKLIPIYDVTGINDFTGKLFNVMNAWVDVPDGGANDVVLTPRYITDFMVKLTQTNMNSYVWDWALGSGGFLISAMNRMINDAQEQYVNQLTKQQQKIEKIKTEQLLGIELLPNVYILAVLNMILMGDGSSNIVNDNSLTHYNGNYAYNEEPFPADVFLLNPPYSAEGNGMIFVEKAFQKQQKGHGAVIIQDSAGSGRASEINKRILKNNRLKASIKMPADLFKASVQTSIYLFDVGVPHQKEDNVYFVDLREDGYTRTNRKKAKNNLLNSNDAKGHYQEVVDIILDKAKRTNYFHENENYYKDTIDPESGNDWNFEQHQVIDYTPTEADFMKTVGGYLSWEVSQLLKAGE
ncbi:HsdM family class I SAM-dependent methyltransferase [Weissella viridescens]|uniref:HsdM family class I SAM-dependent methyltransferase n=1 Tax=Weissella viridescens TaxID=1629 RepID=UPI003AF29D96